MGVNRTETPLNPPEAEDPSAPQGAKPTVPALERAIAILRRLQDQVDPRARTVTAIAQALGIHKSSCSNLLWTLESAGLIEYSASTRAFQLGAELISLGASAAKDRDFVRAAMEPMEAVVQATGFTCVAFEQLASEEFVIVSKVESPREIKVTIDVGQHFHPATPALVRMLVAYKDREARAAYLRRWENRAFTPTTKSDPAEVAAEIAFIIERGYAISRGEYYPGNTAITAPVFSGRDNIFRGLCLVAFNEEAAAVPLDDVGRALRAAADGISRSLGGSPR